MNEEVLNYFHTPPTSSSQARWQRRHHQLQSALKLKTFKLGLLLISVFLLVCLIAPTLMPYSGIELNLASRLQAPSYAHFFGTDELGRDIFSRIVLGTRITLRILTSVALIAGPLGLVVGMSAGFARGLLKAALSSLIDIFLSLPRFVLAMALCASFGPGINNAILAIGLTAWAPYARLIQTETELIRVQDYIQSIIYQGASRFRILSKHILPLCLPTLLVRLNLDSAGFILSAAGLGFLGLGAEPPQPEWGAMIASSRDFLMTHWWLSVFPGLSILAVSLGLNLLGESLRDLLDPKQGRRFE